MQFRKALLWSVSVLFVGVLIACNYPTRVSNRLKLVPQSATLTVGDEQVFTVEGDSDYLDFYFSILGTEDKTITLRKIAHNQVVVRVIRNYDYPIVSTVRLIASSNARNKYGSFEQTTVTIHAVR